MERQIQPRVIPSREVVHEEVKEAIQQYESSTLTNEEVENKEIDSLIYSKVSLESDDAFFEWLKEQMDYMESKLMLVQDYLPSVYEIDYAMMRWPSVSDHLTTIIGGAERAYENATKRRDAFYNCKYMEVRNTYNTLDTKKAMWLSATEISATVYSKYQSEFAILDTDIVDSKTKLSTAKNMQKTWDNYLTILKAIEYRAKSEMQGNMSAPDLKRGDELDC